MVVYPVPYRALFVVALLALLVALLAASPIHAQTYYGIDSSEMVWTKLVTPIGSTQATPIRAAITPGTGPNFARIGVPIEIAITADVDSGMYFNWELDSVSAVIGDTLLISYRKLSNSKKLAWSAGARIRVINDNGVMIKQLRNKITALALPSLSGQSGKYLTNNGTTTSWATVSGGGGGVTSYNTRTGAVVAVNGDYSFAQISGTAAVTQGGTGLTALASGKMLFASSANVLAALSLGTGLQISMGTLSVYLSPFSTSDLSEGSRLYYRDSLARLAITATAPVLYDGATGIISESQATALNNGWLSATDWNRFNLTATGSDTLDHLYVLHGAHILDDLRVDGNTTTFGISNTGTLANNGSFHETGASIFSGNISQNSGSASLLNTTCGTLDASGHVSSGDYVLGDGPLISRGGLIGGVDFVGGATFTAGDSLLPYNNTYGYVTTAAHTLDYSPSIYLVSHGWNTTSVAADTEIDGRITFIPTTGTTVSGKFSLATGNANTGFTERMSISSTGAVTVPGTFALSGNLTLTGALNLFVTGTIATNQTLTTTNCVVPVDATSGTITITLPPSPTAGQELIIAKIDAGANGVTVTPNSGQSIIAATGVLSGGNVGLALTNPTATLVYLGGNQWVLVSRF